MADPPPMVIGLRLRPDRVTAQVMPLRGGAATTVDCGVTPAAPGELDPLHVISAAANAATDAANVVCGKVEHIKKLTLGDLVLSVLPWPFHKDIPSPAGGACKNGGGVGFGMLCSLSIPIVTLCALILLIIIVSLFDFIFRWVPFLFTCFPIPKFEAKKK